MAEPTRSAVFRTEVAKAKPELSPGERVLVDEACRLIDRLDRFAKLIDGDLAAWASIDWPFEEAPAQLVISSVVAEARQHTAELRQVVKQLNLPVTEAAAKPRSVLDELRQKREQRTG